MTRNKDQKRLVRTRMQKTGESYTAARAMLLERGRTSETRSAAPRDQWPALAGQSDAVMKKRTGRTWAEWVALLDRDRAHEMSHRDIARHVAVIDSDISHWWAQSVTVGYERIRGLRDVGQRRGGAYEANKSRTFPVGVATLFAMFKDARRRRRWLPDGITKIRTAIDDKSVRADWHDGTQVNFFFIAKGPDKSAVAVQHAKLASKTAVAGAKAAWNERLDALGEVLR